jgi:hypothetical protein
MGESYKVRLPDPPRSADVTTITFTVVMRASFVRAVGPVIIDAQAMWIQCLGPLSHGLEFGLDLNLFVIWPAHEGTVLGDPT